MPSPISNPNKDAIEEFEKSYDFFSKNVWIDRFRALTMMSPAVQAFREMALVNIAYCYGQIGNKDQTKLYYERALREFPDSSMAQIALNFIQTIQTDTNLTSDASSSGSIDAQNA